MCVKKFIFSKFGGLQAYSRQLLYQMKAFTGIFQQHFKLPPCFDLRPPNQILRSHHMFTTPVHIRDIYIYIMVVFAYTNR